MTLVPTLLAISLFVLAGAFGLHCFVLHCDRRHSKDLSDDGGDSPPLRV